MASHSTLKLLAASCIAVGLLASAFIAGVRTGASESAWLQSTVKGALLVGELRALRSGNAAGLIQMKELELDGQVLYFRRLQDQGHPWLFWPDSDNFEHERYLGSIASYRKEFPALMPTLVVPGSDRTNEAIRKGNREVAETTQAIIRQYGK
jgi:hypothetical protein